jgi:hypothetical protein
MLMWVFSLVIPNSPLLQKYEATFAGYLDTKGVEHIDIGQVSVDGGNLPVTDSQNRR